MQPVSEAWPPEAELKYTEYGDKPCEQLRIRFKGECDPGSDDYYLALAETWRERHVAEYGVLVDALERAAVSRRMSGQRVQLPFRFIRKAAGVNFDQNLDAPMARLVMADVPALRGCIRIKASKVDGYE